MKKRNIYLFLICFPLIVIAFLVYFIKAGNHWPVILLLIYLFIYRPVIDYRRLAEKKLIASKEIWKLYLPFFYFKNFKALYIDP